MGTFFKKNIFFFVIFSVVFGISVFLLVMDISMYGEISESTEKIKAATENYDRERKAKVHPVDQNADKIDEDTVELKKQVIELQRKFGGQYRKFLLVFAKETGFTEDVLLSEFKKHFDEYKVKNGEREETLAEILNRNPYYIKDQVFFRFMDDYREKLALRLTVAEEKKKAESKGQDFDEEKVKASDANRKKIETAYNNFFINIIKEPLFTVEDLAPGDMNVRTRVRNDIFACALGLPRTKRPLDCYTYLLDMQREFIAKRLIPGVTDLATLRKFTYDQYETDNPKSADIPEILLAMPVYEDIAKRLRSVEDLEVTEMSKSGPAPAPASDKYLRYTFKLKINCTMKSIRTFVNKLHAAYNDDRVYAVRWISVNAGSENELAELKKILESQSNGAQNMRQNYRRYGNRTAAETQTALTPYLNSLDPKYGTAIVGKTKGVTAELDFDYYIYIGERVHTYQVNQQ
ncbi:MAG: hypothetical protein J6S53_11275 [Lentisphaeria bacterium]|nr:hypothetical protein [Lentisphaeria bacterium]